MIDPKRAIELVQAELDTAARAYPNPFASAHEGIAVIREEFMELEKEVFWGDRKHKKNHADFLRMEATQLAAMAIRFLSDICMEYKA